jgi:hypothetical protein
MPAEVRKVKNDRLLKCRTGLLQVEGNEMDHGQRSDPGRGRESGDEILRFAN